MLSLRTILCTIDFSDQSPHALTWAYGLAGRHKSRLIVLSAVDPLLASAAKVRLGLDLAAAETVPALRELIASTIPSGLPWAPDAEVQAKVGEAADVILDAAAAQRADLVVMGTHGLGGVRKLLLGSTTERVLRRTRTPVLVVPMGAAEAVRLDAAGPRVALTGILAPTDFTPTSIAALDWAAMLAAEAGVPLLAAHVVSPVAVAPQWRPYVEEADESRVHEARSRLESLAARVPAGVNREALVALGRPADTIATLAREREAGLIVMGLTGTQEVPATRPGSIAYRVLTLSHVPVLVVPAPETPSPPRA